MISLDSFESDLLINARAASVTKLLILFFNSFTHLMHAYREEIFVQQWEMQNIAYRFIGIEH